MWRKILIVGFLVLTTIAAGAVVAQEPEATETSEPSSPSLVGVTWQWVHFADGEQEMEIPSPTYTITFDEDGRFWARTDCNNLLGSYTVDGDAITLMPGPSTLAMCPPESLGDDFARYLGQVVIHSFTDLGDLLLELPADSGTLTLSAQPQVIGTVTYLVRIALPPDAFVRVQIQDVTLPDAPTTVIGEQVIETDGAQVPIPFAVSYPEAAIQEDNRYSIWARITDADGNTLFVSDSYTLVITGGNPTEDVEVVLAQVAS